MRNTNRARSDRHRPGRGRHAVAIPAALLLLTVPLAAQAQTPAEAGDHRASADAAVLELTAGDAVDDVADGFTLLDAAIAPTAAASDTTGQLSFREESGLTAFGVGANAGLTLADELELQGLLVEATQTAPPDNTEPAFEQLLEVPADPLLTSEVATAEALARDVGTDACPVDPRVTAFGDSEVNDTRLLPAAIDEQTDVVHLAGVVGSRSETSLVDVDGQETLGVQAQATATVSDLTLFGELQIELLSEPTLTAVAGGTPGSASVAFDLPVVRINGEGLDANEPQEFSIPPDAAPGEEDLLVRIGFGDVTQSVADDGTTASATASVLRITVLDAADLGTLADIEVAPLSVEAEAPDGGVVCADAAVVPDEGDDLTVVKDAPQEIVAGEDFDYTIDITNERDCTVTDLEVVDVITGPEGTEIVSTDPDADVDGTTVTFSDLDDLEPGDSRTLTITVSVPDDAPTGAVYRNEVTVTGTCDGEAVSGGDTIERPEVVDADGDAGGQPDAGVAPDRVRDDGGDVRAQPAARPLPATGGGVALLGLLSLGAAAVLRRS